MKWMRKNLYFGMAILGLSIPLKVHGAGKDTVVLGQDGSQAAVSLEMSNASEEKITTVAVSLEVKTDDGSPVSVEFSFSSALSGTEHGYVYHEDTGRLDIYVASSKGLFQDEKLSLGNVKVQPADPERSVTANVNYCKDSFQTANGSYGNKTPVVEDEVKPVSIQIGNGALTPTDPDNGNSGNGSSDIGNSGNVGNTGGAGSQGSGGSGHGSGSGGGNGSNIDQGLYDETTRFTNDPASAQPITSSIVKRDKDTLAGNLTAGLTGAAAQKGGGSGAGGVSLAKTKGKVSVVSPKNGPASIRVSNGKDGIAGEDMPDGLLAGGKGNAGETEGGFGAGIFGNNNSEDGSGESLSGEILLDQENGGAVKNKKNGKLIQVLICCAAFAGASGAAGGVAVLFLKKRRIAAAGGKRKKRKKRPVKRKKKAVRHRTGKNRRTM